jgi:8-amino-7-oxononanoate synthase
LTWADWVDEQCRVIDEAGRWRSPSTFDAAGPVGIVESVEMPVVSFASNDYLGLTQHPAVKAAAIDAVDRWGTGSGASRLVVGTRPVHHDLERQLADWRGTEAALVFSTGYAANTGLLATLGGPGTLICSDELNHASIIDGCAMARGRGAEVCVYPHGDLDLLGQRLGALEPDRRAVVVTDTVFSMDGDEARLDDLAALCRRHRALLVLDDAHAVFPIDADLDGAELVRVGTLSKTLGAMGGFIAASTRLVELLVNRARPFIFTTAPTPADTAAAAAALAVVRSDEGDRLRAKLRRHIDAVQPGHPSPIIPIIVGREDAAVAASRRLLDRGLLVPAIRPPTVAPGTSRLRVALSASHTDEQVAGLAAALADLGSTPGDGPDRP